MSINKYDPFQLKAGIDDCVVALLEERGFQEDNTYMDRKIVVSVLAIAVALLSQFYKPDETWEFPKANKFQMCCIALYGACMAMYYYIDYYQIADTFFCSSVHPVS